MPAHLWRRPDRNSIFYIVDGDYKKTTETDKIGLARERLKQYERKKFGCSEPLPTVGEYYETTWIDRKREPLYRRAQIRDYRWHFQAYILPRFKDARLSDIGVSELTDFMLELVHGGRAVKTARNIIDASFRAFYRDARLEMAELQGRDPFAEIRWPPKRRQRPDPFSAEERDRVLAYWREHDFFYYPWVFTLFHTGMRPSEASALTWRDVDLTARRIVICKSRYLGRQDEVKTYASDRDIPISKAVAEALALLPSRKLGLEHVFVNKYGEPLNAKKWSEHNWGKTLVKLKIRHRKFYATRHTFITEAIRRGRDGRGESPLAVAQYCGTSLTMIQADYCGALSLDMIEPFSPPTAPNYSENMVAGPGFEPLPVATSNDGHCLSSLQDYKLRRRKVG